MSQSGPLNGNTGTITGADEFITDSGTAVPILGEINVFGGNGASTSGSGNTITINVSGVGLSYPGLNCGFKNLSWVVTAGVLTISGADGTALSVSNPGYVLARGSQPSETGRLLQYAITANQTLTVSDMTGNTFGTNAGLAWTSTMPLYIGLAATNNGTDPIFCVTRIPTKWRATSGGAEIGMPSLANANTSTSMFLFSDSVDTVFDTGTGIAILGAIRAVKDASDAWTIQSSGSGKMAGIGKFLESTIFAYPNSQNGAASGSYFKDNGGTAPVFSSNSYSYQIDRNGKVTIFIKLSGDGGADGAGAVDATLSLPLPCDNAVVTTRQLGSVIVNSQGVGATTCAVNYVDDATQTCANLRSTSTINVLNGDFSSGGRWVEGQASYYAYKGFN
jgi:hypothetical protein